MKIIFRTPKLSWESTKQAVLTTDFKSDNALLTSNTKSDDGFVYGSFESEHIVDIYACMYLLSSEAEICIDNGVQVLNAG